MKIVLSTKNKGKIIELMEALEPLNQYVNSNIEWMTMQQFNIDSPKEDKASFIENSLLKAQHSSYHSNLPALADDSGLCVEALNNEPGIYSARYAGENSSDTENCEKLLRNLDGISARKAFFYCVIAYVNHAKDPTPIIAEGRWYGEILHQPEGQKGFGYDSIFQGEGLQKSTALLTQKEKLLHSHRGKAINHFISQWKKSPLLV